MAPTWYISGSWNLDEEDFIQDYHLSNLLALRATYGLNVSMGAATNSSLVLRSASTPRPSLDDVEPVLNIISNPNLDLTWEIHYETNIGMDAAWNRRLEWPIDAYQH